MASDVQVTFTCSICRAVVLEGRVKPAPEPYERDSDWWVRRPPHGWVGDRCRDCVSAINEAEQAAIAKRTVTESKEGG